MNMKQRSDKSKKGKNILIGSVIGTLMDMPTSNQTLWMENGMYPGIVIGSIFRIRISQGQE
jgi:hypothetical protein